MCDWGRAIYARLTLTTNPSADTLKFVFSINRRANRRRGPRDTLLAAASAGIRVVPSILLSARNRLASTPRDKSRGAPGLGCERFWTGNTFRFAFWLGQIQRGWVTNMLPTLLF